MMPVGLEMWELVAISAMCSLTALSVFSTIAVSVAYLATRESEPVAAPAPAAKPVPTFAPVPVAG
ncbi:hypothetical protein GobsT_13550 [Gemmata obscuriglobus]|uniref:Uncharacterized protein n=1 Tax=Gemmata obscuriglobus TaxID=114 RepID=A0A2Z3H5N9_9BACT|nr:hypothetical protein [Gemmata obscuriglobus]AWM40201.1 hypothetical protein C1280_26480 [Gemmata obscuriglobus]QEG26612.1 hypothetical protein GobsT_13550 [Gemmata obscuriglobus]VTS02125.1 unnamed protein product [Gemmata obscuriglobus UQM 2246]